jgi:hypothetical protein
MKANRTKQDGRRSEKRREEKEDGKEKVENI